ncbi:serpentine type 7TM GPCR chemoreceptor srt domain-containing protein [Ditylenchus destructor]|uniref:Serpentine type 7TM GPCR chemoreceptor srt domain-containing protein n=1 Tax=Ditylenchus destructor TaxID=166010 RepID=A0AAD4QWY2_9BILA|nr:serpentine type 7TM GPCR chemoreceptor srt domain-containing protein [Ditylenchus destructor]
MEMYFFKHDEWERLYNCSLYRVDDIPLEKRQHIALGVFFILVSIIFITLYTPCIIAVRNHLKHSCYKFLFFLGIVDILSIPMNGILTGYMTIVGAMFCNYPKLLYFSGSYGYFCWITETTMAIFLALNRCCEILSPNIARYLFHGQLPWLWMIVLMMYGLYFAIFTKPVMFNGIYMAWFNNPHVGYNDDPGGITYGNHLHFVHNIIVCCSLTGLYVLFCILYLLKSRTLRRHSSNAGPVFVKNTLQRSVFIQVLLISSINTIGSALYIYMQFVNVTPWLTIAAQFSWIIINGMPGILFLVVNKTIRTECIQMIFKISKAAPTSENQIYALRPISGGRPNSQ